MGTPTGHYVYLYYEEGNALPFYVGKGKGRRAWKHLYFSARRDTPFYCKLAAIREFGDKPEIIIQQDDLTETEALALEKYLVNFYGKRSNSTGCLLNLQEGGTQPFCEEETRKKISETLKIFHATPLGKEIGKRGAARSSVVRGGRPIIGVMQPMGYIFEEYEYAELARKDGYDRRHISACLKGESKTHKDLEWYYADDPQVANFKRLPVTS